jgi:hypothetical protein
MRLDGLEPLTFSALVRVGTETALTGPLLSSTVFGPVVPGHLPSYDVTPGTIGLGIGPAGTDAPGEPAGQVGVEGAPGVYRSMGATQPPPVA